MFEQLNARIILICVWVLTETTGYSLYSALMASHSETQQWPKTSKKLFVAYLHPQWMKNIAWTSITAVAITGFLVLFFLNSQTFVYVSSLTRCGQCGRIQWTRTLVLESANLTRSSFFISVQFLYFYVAFLFLERIRRRYTGNISNIVMSLRGARGARPALRTVLLISKGNVLISYCFMQF
jgi:hypothetical protein